MKIGQKEISGFVVASRVPNLLIIAYTQFATAFFILDRHQDSLVDLRFLGLILSTILIGAGGYIINDYFDQKIDMINRPGRVVVGAELRRRLALAAHLALSVSGVAVGFLIDPIIGAIHIFSTGALWTYSIALKRVLLLSTLMLSFLTMLSILIVLVYFKQVSLVAMVYALFGCATTFIRETLKDIVDAKGDKAFGVHSLPNVWGIRGAKIAIYLVCLAGIGLLFAYLIAIPNEIVKYYFLGLTPLMILFIILLVKADRIDEFKKLKMGIDVITLSGLVSIALI